MNLSNYDIFRRINYLGDRRLLNPFTDESCFNEIQNLCDHFASTHCLYPSKVFQIDHFTGELVPGYYSCGQCDHCRNIKSNELITRIYLDSKIQGHLYFVTLTYSSVYYKNGVFYGLRNYSNSYRNFTYIPYVLNDKVINVLTNNILHYDNKNYRKRYCYSTCLLNMDDYSGFMKRLRVAHPGVNFQGVCFGEYGHKFGHPHMHALISSNVRLSLDDFKNAWSLYGCPIGNVDVDDLFSSGKNSSIDATTKYVTKYVSKREVSNKTRLKYAYHLKNYTPIFKGLPTYINKQILLCYETIIKQAKRIPLRGLSYYFDKIDEEETPLYFREFVRLHCQSARYSNRSAFGSLYFAASIERFKTGNKRLPKNGTTKLSFPRYFERKIQEQKYSIRVYKSNPAGSHFYSQPNYPSMVRTFEMLSKDIKLDNNYPITSYSASFIKNYNPFFITGFSHLYDSSTKEHLLYDLQTHSFIPFRYSRKVRGFRVSGPYRPFNVVVDSYCKQQDMYYLETISQQINKDYQNKIYDILFDEIPDALKHSRELESYKWDLQRDKSMHRIINDKYNVL